MVVYCGCLLWLFTVNQEPGVEREVEHYWLTAWPSDGLPDHRSVLKFLATVRPLMEASAGPAVIHCWSVRSKSLQILDNFGKLSCNTSVHVTAEQNPGITCTQVAPSNIWWCFSCSPGTGRSGVLVALDIAMLAYEHSHKFNVPYIVYQIRCDRGGLVQTKDQYTFIYKVRIRGEFTNSASVAYTRDSDLWRVITLTPPPLVQMHFSGYSRGNKYLTPVRSFYFVP